MKDDDHHIQARKDGLATFLKAVACSTDLFFSRKIFLLGKISFLNFLFQAEFQEFLATGPFPAKQQADFIKQKCPIIVDNNQQNPSLIDLQQAEVT